MAETKKINQKKYCPQFVIPTRSAAQRNRDLAVRTAIPELKTTTCRDSRACYIPSQVTQPKLYPWTALVLLTTLNLLNYIDRSVLFAVQPLVQGEFQLTKAQVGYLTSAFLVFYMLAAPFVGPLADRYSRKLIIILGAIFWSGLTLLTAVTHTYGELLLRHTLVGVGEATFVTIAPTFVADLFTEEKRGRILGIFYLAIPAGPRQGTCWEALSARPWMAVSVLHCRGSGVPAGACVSFCPNRSAAISIAEGNPGAGNHRGCRAIPLSGRPRWAWQR